MSAEESITARGDGKYLSGLSIIKKEKNAHTKIAEAINIINLPAPSVANFFNLFFAKIFILRQK